MQTPSRYFQGFIVPDTETLDNDNDMKATSSFNGSPLGQHSMPENGTAFEQLAVEKTKAIFRSQDEGVSGHCFNK